jgi:hypothetical protein
MTCQRRSYLDLTAVPNATFIMNVSVASEVFCPTCRITEIGRSKADGNATVAPLSFLANVVNWEGPRATAMLLQGGGHLTNTFAEIPL